MLTYVIVYFDQHVSSFMCLTIALLVLCVVLVWRETSTEDRRLQRDLDRAFNLPLLAPWRERTYVVRRYIDPQHDPDPETTVRYDAFIDTCVDNKNRSLGQPLWSGFGHGKTVEEAIRSAIADYRKHHEEQVGIGAHLSERGGGARDDQKAVVHPVLSK